MAEVEAVAERVCCVSVLTASAVVCKDFRKHASSECPSPNTCETNSLCSMQMILVR